MRKHPDFNVAPFDSAFETQKQPSGVTEGRGTIILCVLNSLGVQRMFGAAGTKGVANDGDLGDENVGGEFKEEVAAGFRKKRERGGKAWMI